MISAELVNHTRSIVKKDFYFESIEELLPENEMEAMNELRKVLTARIAHMLDHDFELLMQIFYRIDLNENKVKEAIALADEPSEKLAELVLEREMQKAKTRMAYKNRLH